ncbi:MAG: prepilin-type N-terminal cleavage/methylation domain-containing protein [Gemmatimonadota bacterium]|nr:MAG: prepilin-type N-terminal cleavage/methylation domain-containing protein [Gemmatimonadota bacterium]
MSKGLGSGFTLVEVMVALVVLAVSVLGLSAAVSVVSSNTKISHLRTKVSVRAQAEMERLLASGPDRLGSGAVVQGDLHVQWEVSGVSPKQILLVARQRLGRWEAADTLVTFVAARSADP